MRFSAVVSLVCVLLSAGCGYALTGRGNTLPASIRRIGIPAFANRSQIADIDRVLTDAVVAEFQSKGKYQVQPSAADADAVLTVIITNVVLQPVVFAAGSQASRYVIVATASVEFTDVHENKVIWSTPAFQERDEYDVPVGATGDAAALYRQDASAHERLAKRFARSVVSAIFEAF